MEKRQKVGNLTNHGPIIKVTSQTVHVLSNGTQSVWRWNNFPAPGGYYSNHQWLKASNEVDPIIAEIYKDQQLAYK